MLLNVDNSKTFAILTWMRHYRKETKYGATRDLYLIYKESMNNIVKHASANNVGGCAIATGRLYLKIKDDGRIEALLSVIVTVCGISVSERANGREYHDYHCTGNGFIEIIIPLAGE